MFGLSSLSSKFFIANSAKTSAMVKKFGPGFTTDEYNRMEQLYEELSKFKSKKNTILFISSINRSSINFQISSYSISGISTNLLP